MAKTLTEAVGYLLGRKAAQAKSAFDLMGGGTEEESLRAEIRLGHDLTAAMLERNPLVEENETTVFAAQIGRWLAAHVKEKKLPFKVWVTAAPEPNAIALPGGPIFITRPLLELCHGERDEIAFLLGHEMGHIVRRHALDRIVQDAALALLLRHASGQQATRAWLGDTGRQMLQRAFSRDEELEADTFAASLLRTAGGEVSAGNTLLEKLAQLTAGRNLSLAGPYLSTHPPLAERIANLRQQG